MKTINTAILAILLFSLASSCTSITNMATEIYWNMDDPAPVDPDEAIDTLCIIKYIIDNEPRQTVIHNQRDIDIFLYQILSNAKQSSDISMQTSWSRGQTFIQSFSDSPVVTFNSSDINKVKEWAKRMLLSGYKVEITYNKKTKEYHCTARPKN